MLKLNKTIKFYTVIKMEEGFSVFIKILCYMPLASRLPQNIANFTIPLYYLANNLKGIKLHRKDQRFNLSVPEINHHIEN